MKSAYLGISLSKRPEFNQEIEILRQCLREKSVELKVFVDMYSFAPNQEKQMMDKAFAEIEACEFMVVELSHKAIGVGVEVGYARARNIPVVYLRRKGAPYSTTVGGCSDFEIEYENLEELDRKMRLFMEEKIV